MISIATLLAMGAKKDCDLKVILQLAKDCVYLVYLVVLGPKNNMHTNESGQSLLGVVNLKSLDS